MECSMYEHKIFERNCSFISFIDHHLANKWNKQLTKIYMYLPIHRTISSTGCSITKIWIILFMKNLHSTSFDFHHILKIFYEYQNSTFCNGTPCIGIGTDTFFLLLHFQLSSLLLLLFAELPQIKMKQSQNPFNHWK